MTHADCIILETPPIPREKLLLAIVRSPGDLGASRHGERLPVAEPGLRAFMASQDALPPCPAPNLDHSLDLERQSLHIIGC